MHYARIRLLTLIFVSAWNCPSVAGEGAESAQPASAQPGTGQPAPSEPAPVQVRRAALEGRPSLQMSSDFGSPSLAIASYRPVGDVESPGIRIAPFTVRAAAISGVGFDDNVSLAPENKISSMFLSFAPSVAIGSEGGTERYYAIYRGNYGRYTSSAVDNFDDHNLGLIAVNEWTTRLRSQASYEFLRGHNPRGYTVTNTTTPDRWDWHSLRGAVSYGAEGSQARIEGAAGMSSRRYVTNRLVNAARDYEQVDVGGTFFYRLAPKTRALVQVTHSDITHDSDPSLDSAEFRYAVGVTWEALAKTQGTLRVGLVTKDFADATRPDFTGPAYEAVVTWSPMTYSVVNVTARKTISETAEIGSAFTVSDAVAVAWNHDWSERTRSALYYIHDQQSFRGIDRNDTAQSISIRTSYALRRWLRVGAELRHDSRDSSVPAADYKRNITLFSVEAAL